MTMKCKELSKGKANDREMSGKQFWVLAITVFICALDASAANENCVGKFHHSFHVYDITKFSCLYTPLPVCLSISLRLSLSSFLSICLYRCLYLSVCDSTPQAR